MKAFEARAASQAARRDKAADEDKKKKQERANKRAFVAERANALLEVLRKAIENNAKQGHFSASACIEADGDHLRIYRILGTTLTNEGFRIGWHYETIDHNEYGEPYLGTYLIITASW